MGPHPSRSAPHLSPPLTSLCPSFRPHHTHRKRRGRPFRRGPSTARGQCRQRYIGIRTGKVPQFFESESTQSATVPTSLQRVEGHLKMFAEALAQHAPSASLAALDLLAGRPTAPHAFFVTFGLRLRLPASAPAAEAQGEPAAEWDEGAPWRAWASPADPLADVMLELLWPRLPPDPALSALHRPPADAAVWTLEALAAPANRNLPGAAVSLADGAPGGRRPTVGGFAEMLQHLAEAGRHARAACSIGDLAEDYWQRAGLSPPRSPPERVMQRVLSDIFDVAGGSGQDSGASAGARRGLSVERSAPPGSLLARLALHSLVFANARAVGQLWLRFVQELRFRHWDAGRPLPRTGAPEAPDVSCCLLHQKLQMLDICIRELSSDRCRDHPTEDTFGTDAWPEWGWESEAEDFHSCSSGEGDSDGGGKAGPAPPRGVAEPHPALHLVGEPGRRLNIPRLQRPPVLTEDMQAERAGILQTLEEGPLHGVELRVRGEQLISDMSAFKAANPGSQLADFVRWYSPSDWEPEDGGRLSRRMAAEGNAWARAWGLAEPRTAAEQKPLFDASREGERALHHLETVPPGRLLAELQAVAASSAMHILAQSAGGSLSAAASRLSEFAVDAGRALSLTAGDDSEEAEGVFATLCDGVCRAENAVYLGESLLRRFGSGNSGIRLGNELMSSALSGSCTAEVSEATEKQYLGDLLRANGLCEELDWKSLVGESRSELLVECGSDRRSAARHHWLVTFSETGLQISTVVSDEAAAQL